MENGVGGIQIRIGTRLAIGAERLLERRCRGCRAKARIAIHVRGAKSSLANHSKRVVFLVKQLATGIKSDRAGSMGADQLTRSIDNETHRCVPRGTLKYAVAPNERVEEAIGAAVCLPSMQPFRTQAAVIHRIDRAAPHAHDAPVFYADVDAAAIGTEYTGGLHPAVRLFQRTLIDPYRPLANVWRPCSPYIGYAVSCLVHGSPSILT